MRNEPARGHFALRKLDILIDSFWIASPLLSEMHLEAEEDSLVLEPEIQQRWARNSQVSLASNGNLNLDERVEVVAIT